MPSYDGILFSSQLGNDLQIGATVGGYTVQPFADAGSGPLVSLCVHQGSRFAAWTELREHGADPAYIYGPFVKRYDPASGDWVQIGDVEPSLTLVDASGSWDTIPSSFAVGTRFFPSRPQLVTDGTSLYIVYSIHETIAMHTTTLNPLKLVVRRWNGSVWELYGEIPAVGRNESTSAATWDSMTAAASSHDPGACYVTLVQGGETGPFSVGNPILFQGVVARFDGSSLAGDVNVIGTPNTNPSFFDTGSTLIGHLSVRYDDADGPWIWWLGEISVVHGSAGTPTWYLQRFDGTIVQQWDSTVAGAPSEGASGAGAVLGYEPHAWLVDVGFPDSSEIIRSLIADGSTSALDPLDGLLPELIYPEAADPLPPETEPHFAKLVSEPPDNIWAIDSGASLPGAIWLYHRPCRAWTRVFQQSTTFNVNAWQLQVDPDIPPEDRPLTTGYIFFPSDPADPLDFVVHNGLLTVVAWVKNVLTGEGHLRAYELPILRGAFGCAREIGRGVYIVPFYVPFGNQPAPV